MIIELRPADRSVSPYGQRVLGIFRKRVTAALRDFENRQIEVVVQTRDGIVRGIPRREDGAVLVGDKIVSS